MGKGLVVHQAAHGLDGTNDLLVCCLHVPTPGKSVTLLHDPGAVHTPQGTCTLVLLG